MVTENQSLFFNKHKKINRWDKKQKVNYTRDKKGKYYANEIFGHLQHNDLYFNLNFYKREKFLYFKVKLFITTKQYNYIKLLSYYICRKTKHHFLIALLFSRIGIENRLIEHKW